jgi:hypothetical protein
MGACMCVSLISTKFNIHASITPVTPGAYITVRPINHLPLDLEGSPTVSPSIHPTVLVSCMSPHQSKSCRALGCLSSCTLSTYPVSDSK